MYDGSTQLEQVQLTIQAVILSHRRAASRYFTGLSLYLSLKADLTILHWQDGTMWSVTTSCQLTDLGHSLATGYLQLNILTENSILCIFCLRLLTGYSQATHWTKSWWQMKNLKVKAVKLLACLPETHHSHLSFTHLKPVHPGPISKGAKMISSILTLYHVHPTCNYMILFWNLSKYRGWPCVSTRSLHRSLHSNSQIVHPCPISKGAKMHPNSTTCPIKVWESLKNSAHL